MADKMTRSDIVLEKVRAETIEQKDVLIERLHYKIDQVYVILFAMEKRVEEGDKALEPLAQILRKALEI